MRYILITLQILLFLTLASCKKSSELDVESKKYWIKTPVEMNDNYFVYDDSGFSELLYPDSCISVSETNFPIVIQNLDEDTALLAVAEPAHVNVTEPFFGFLGDWVDYNTETSETDSFGCGTDQVTE